MHYRPAVLANIRNTKDIMLDYDFFLGSNIIGQILSQLKEEEFIEFELAIYT